MLIGFQFFSDMLIQHSLHLYLTYSMLFRRNRIENWTVLVRRHKFVLHLWISHLVLDIVAKITSKLNNKINRKRFNINSNNSLV